MARVGVMADVHANLPALEAALGAIRRLECDVVYSLGDAIAIGPHPAECLDLLLEAPGLVCLMGNHDAWYVRGLPQPRPEWLSEGEIAHQRWVHAQLGPGRRGAVARWPWVVSETFDGVRVTLLHYEPADDPGCFAPCRRDSTSPPTFRERPAISTRARWAATARRRRVSWSWTARPGAARSSATPCPMTTGRCSPRSRNDRCPSERSCTIPFSAGAWHLERHPPDEPGRGGSCAHPRAVARE